MAMIYWDLIKAGVGAYWDFMGSHPVFAIMASVAVVAGLFAWTRSLAYRAANSR